MLLIRGDTRVADIYMTELDRIFRHFRARDIINHEAAQGEREQWLLLDPTDGWIGSNFKDGAYKDNRRLLFSRLRRPDPGASPPATIRIRLPTNSSVPTMPAPLATRRQGNDALKEGLRKKARRKLPKRPRRKR